MDKTYFVYLIQRGQDGPVKIGYARDPARRLKDLQVGSAEKLRLLRQLKCASKQHAQDVEKFLHAQFCDLQLTGEWFPASVLEAVEALEIPQPGSELPRRYRGGKLVPMYVGKFQSGIWDIHNINRPPRPAKAKAMRYFDDYSGTWKYMKLT